MVLFSLASDSIEPMRRLNGTKGFLESDIEDIIWENLSDVCGEQLFAVKRQMRISTGGIVDIVALDQNARVVVIEIKRGVDRNQLSQVLEYAAWAQQSSLEELADVFHAGSERFWGDWQDFTGTQQPQRISSEPRMILIAEGYDTRTESAIQYLASQKVKVELISLTVYGAKDGSKFLDVKGIREPIFDAVEQNKNVDLYDPKSAWGISVAELLEAHILEVGERLEWSRPSHGVTYRATVLSTGEIQLEDGRVWQTPSGAAKNAANSTSANGWVVWRVPRLGEGKTLNDALHILGRRRFEEARNS